VRPVSYARFPFIIQGVFVVTVKQGAQNKEVFTRRPLVPSEIVRVKKGFLINPVGNKALLVNGPVSVNVVARVVLHQAEGMFEGGVESFEPAGGNVKD
jgi:hypothetical protein